VRRVVVLLLSVTGLALGAVACGGSASTSSAGAAISGDTTTQSAVSPSTSSATIVSATTTAPPGVAASPGVSLAPLAAGSLTGRTIVIDPGHNGRNWSHSTEIAQPVFIGNRMKECDTSGTATDAGYPETAHNWDVAVRTSQLLRAAGATVVMTRPDDDGWGPCITERAAIGNDTRADAAISIHADGGPDSGRGFHVLYPSPIVGYSEPIAEPSRRLAVLVRDAYGSRTGVPTSNYVGSAGLMARDDLGGLNLSTVPKVFIETGNMRNSTDASLLSDPAFRQVEAEGIAAGLASFVTSP
jgi:N-acetylmuramoyl-L-alanine amidase